MTYFQQFQFTKIKQDFHVIHVSLYLFTTLANLLDEVESADRRLGTILMAAELGRIENSLGSI